MTIYSNTGGKLRGHWGYQVAGAYVHKVVQGQEVFGEKITSNNKKRTKKIPLSYKCLDCPQIIHRGKRCRVCAEIKHNQYNMAEPSEIMNKVYKI